MVAATRVAGREFFTPLGPLLSPPRIRLGGSILTIERIKKFVGLRNFYTPPGSALKA